MQNVNVEEHAVQVKRSLRFSKEWVRTEKHIPYRIIVKQAGWACDQCHLYLFIFLLHFFLSRACAWRENWIDPPAGELVQSHAVKLKPIKKRIYLPVSSGPRLSAGLCREAQLWSSELVRCTFKAQLHPKWEHRFSWTSKAKTRFSKSLAHHSSEMVQEYKSKLKLPIASPRASQSFGPGGFSRQHGST